MAGIADVAAAARVTVGTVSRVLNGDPTVRVRPDTRERIYAAAREVDYTPNYAARALRRSRVGVIGLAVHDVTNPVYAAIISGAQRAVAHEGYLLMLADVQELARDKSSFSRIARSGLIDGLLLLPAGDDADDELAATVSGIVPTVIVNDSSAQLSSVTVDNTAGMRMATEHLIAQGHRSIGYLALDGDTERSRSRTDGWRIALQDAGLPVRAEWMIEAGHTAETGEIAAREVLALPERPSAVVVASVMAATGVLAACREQGLRLPQDLSVIAFNDVFFAAQLDPALTVVTSPLAEMGSASVELLLRLLSGGEAEHLIVRDPPPALILRGSTTAP